MTDIRSLPIGTRVDYSPLPIRDTWKTVTNMPTSTKPTKKSRKPGKAQLIKKADKYFSIYVRYRDGKFQNGQWITECITCGVWKPIAQMQAGHFMSRGKYPTRWEEENVNSQCVSCNMFKSGEQYKYGLALEKKYGEGTAERLAQMSHEVRKFSIADLEQIINDCKEQIKFYERES
jgi:hypothetical protein